MFVHEYQAKNLLSRYGFSFPAGEVVFSADEAGAAAHPRVDEERLASGEQRRHPCADGAYLIHAVRNPYGIAQLHLLASAAYRMVLRPRSVRKSQYPSMPLRHRQIKTLVGRVGRRRNSSQFATRRMSMLY